MKLENASKSIPWWFWIAGINSILVFLSALQHSFLFPTTARRILTQFDLGQEMNLAAWWSSMILFSIGLLCYELYSDRNTPKKLAWLLLAIAFTCLSIDEIGSVHERIETWIELIDPYVPIPLVQLIDPYVPVAVFGIILVPLPLIILWRFPQTQKSAVFIAIGFLLLATIAVQERLEGAIEWNQWGGIRLGVEEGTELLGMFFCSYGAIEQRFLPEPTNGLRRAIPNPFRLKNIPKIVSVGIMIHLCLTIFTSFFIEVDYSGRTLVWYPAAVFFLLYLATYWKNALVKYPKPKIWSLSYIYFFASSAIASYLIYPSISPKLPALVEPNFFYIYGLQLFLILIIYRAIYRNISKETSILIFLLVISLLLGLSIQGEIARYTVAGIFSYLIARLLLFRLLEGDKSNKLLTL